jgi:hypothetical protein
MHLVSSNLYLCAAKSTPASLKPVPTTKSSGIWDEDEVLSRLEAAQEADDGRARPPYEILLGQHVGTEDVYLGMSDKSPSSLYVFPSVLVGCDARSIPCPIRGRHCETIVVRVSLAGEAIKDIDLDVTATKLCVQSPR